MTDELKPCPFCPRGGNPNIYGHNYSWFVRCDCCKAQSGRREHPYQAVDAWNKRASVLEPFPCSECEKPPRLVKNEEKGWSIGCCRTRFWWYDTEEEAIRDWNKHWRNRRVKE